MKFSSVLLAMAVGMIGSTLPSSPVATETIHLPPPVTRTGSPTGFTTAASPTPATFNCMTEWLRISSATDYQAENIPYSAPGVQAELDEENILRWRPFFLSLVLGYAPVLATHLRKCVERKPDCPFDGDFQQYPCSEHGKCVFNSTLGIAVCSCPPGLTGTRCDKDVDECSSKSRNECDNITVAACLNVHGSYGCECLLGYEGENGRRCEDQNECSTGSHDCHQHAVCNNTRGSFTCQCDGGYLGNGADCEVDPCSSSANSGLCRQIEAIKQYNIMLVQKLEERDQQMHDLLDDMKLMATIFAHHDVKIRKISKEIIKSKKQASATETPFDIRGINSTLHGQGALLSMLIENITDITQAVGQVNTTLRREIARVEEHEAQKCGIVSWKTFTRSGYSNTANVFRNVVFNKTRSDTMLRIVYTSAFGYVHGDRNWHCVKVSVLVNNTDCADPAPIISEAAGTTVAHTIHPGVVSGVCNVPTAGPLLFTTQVAKSCPTYTSFIYDGYSPANIPLTATLHIEELCKP